jgi:hypothetical protein
MAHDGVHHRRSASEAQFCRGTDGKRTRVPELRRNAVYGEEIRERQVACSRVGPDCPEIASKMCGMRHDVQAGLST